MKIALISDTRRKGIAILELTDNGYDVERILL